jgi:phenylalanyl-tRNA synthetase beta chain
VCLLNKMQLQAESHSLKGEPRISVSVPPTRSDILHARDLSEVYLLLSSCSFNCFCRYLFAVTVNWFNFRLASTKDVAIAYGFNNVPKSKPKCMTIGGRQPLNRFSDKIRAEVL